MSDVQRSQTSVWNRPTGASARPTCGVALPCRGQTTPAVARLAGEPCQRSERWHYLWKDQYISINLSTHQFNDATLLQDIAGQMDELGMPSSALRLEITETQLLVDWEAAIAWLDTARALGIGVMLDDFGTGYSSLAYLHRLPLPALKIDRSFVGTMLVDAGSRKILRTIILLARDLGVDCIAEGIEAEAQAEALAEFGVLYGQGYHLGRPEPLRTAT